MAHQWNIIQMAFRWWADVVPTLNASWIQISTDKETYSFLIFQGGGGVRTPVPPPSVSAHGLDRDILIGPYLGPNCLQKLKADNKTQPEQEKRYASWV